MIYVYCALISFAVSTFLFVVLAALIVWAVPRYGAKAVRMAITPRFPSMPPE